ncbi:hypothetical protein [Romboutsia sedimentorum]
MVKDGLIYQEGKIRGNKKIISNIVNCIQEVYGPNFSEKL